MSAIESDLSDIQFLGNWNSQQSSSPSFVSAIVLTPIGAGPILSDIPRTFSRHQTSVVHVGRTVTADPAILQDDSATFSNPVMSRKHAKITFADSGSVFLIDTNSHHGTWVTRSGAEIKLSAESPFQLHDGDEVTFGKLVQRNGVHHNPLTVAVKLLHCASTPSSMSISSTSVSPVSKVSSPKPRNRFGLDTSSDSDPASDIEDSDGLQPCTGPNAIRVELPHCRSEDHDSASSSPKPPPHITSLVQSRSGSPANTQDIFFTSLISNEMGYPTAPISSPSFPGDLLSTPGLELEGMAPADAAHEGCSNSNLQENHTPPWRRLSGSHWSNVNTSIFDRIPDLLQHPPRKLGRLLNPLWVRASRIGGIEERGESSDSLTKVPNGGDLMGILHGSHGGHPTHDQHEHSHVLNHNHNLHPRSPYYHGHGGHSLRLDADWGLYGQNGEALKEVRILSERLGEVQKDVENLKTKGEEGNDLYQVFDRLDELSSQLKNKIAEDAKVSQQALFAESAGLSSLKEDIVALQTDVSCLKTHTTALQSDIRFLRADHVDIKMDFGSIKANSEKHNEDMAVLTDSVKNLRTDAEDLRSEFEALRNQSPVVQQDLTELSNHVSGLHNRIETLQSKISTADVCIVEINDELRALTKARATAEQNTSELFKEQVRSEVKALLEGGELSPIIGKRKRSDEESVDPPANVITPTTVSETRPRKRLRAVVDCAAAGALGALGAWLGLAFL